MNKLKIILLIIILKSSYSLPIELNLINSTSSLDKSSYNFENNLIYDSRLDKSINNYKSTNLIKQFNNLDNKSTNLINQFNNLDNTSTNLIKQFDNASIVYKDIDFIDGIRLKCYLNIMNSIKNLKFIDILLIRKESIKTDWYKKNENLCRSYLKLDNQYRLYPGLIELKFYKLKLMFTLIKWKIESIIKFQVWFLVMIARFKQGIFGRSIIRDDDINLLIRLFFPELFPPIQRIILSKPH